MAAARAVTDFPSAQLPEIAFAGEYIFATR